MRIIPAVLIASLALILLSPRAEAQLASLETEDIRLIYFDTLHSYLAPHTARASENALRFHRRLFHYEPWEKITVLMTDFADYGNAGASASPQDYVALEVSPKSFAYETYPSNERMNTLMNHELVHVVDIDKAARRDRFFRHLFVGKIPVTPDHPETILYSYLTTPRLAAPRWYHEGIAVFIETWMAGGLGRAQGSYDEMVFRSMVRDSTPFYDPLGLVSEGTRVDFQLEANSYLYGTRFMSYLALQYGPETLVDWVSRADGSKAYYSSQFEKVFGESLDQVWSEWVEWEHEFQQANLERIRAYPTTPYVDLSARALGSVSRAYYDAEAGKIYTAFYYPGVVAHVGSISIEDGTLERLREVKDPVIYSVTSLAFDPDRRVLYYTTDNNAYRDIYTLDPDTGKSRRLLEDVRIGEIVFNRADRSLWGIRHFNGIATLVRIQEPYERWEQVHSWPYGTVMYDLDVSPDGQFLSASVGEINGHHTLRIMETSRVLDGDMSPVAEVDFGTTIPSNFIFSADGRYLFGSSYYTGVSNIFRYEIATQELEAVSNCETGMFRPMPLTNESLIVFRYTGEGFVPSRIEALPLEDINPIQFLGQQIAQEHPVVRDWQLGSPAKIPLDSLIERQGEYEPFKSLRITGLYPLVEGYKDSNAFGLRADFSDPIQLNNLNITASYSPDDSLPSDERAHGHVNFKRNNWTASFKWNDADFYDLFGPTKTSRKGYALGTAYRKILVYDDPRHLEFTVDGTYFGDLEELPSYQDVATTFDRLFQSNVGLSYRNMRASIGAVEYEKGIKAEAVASNNYVNGSSVPSMIVNFDAGFPLPLHNSSVWLRNSLGAAFGEIDDPFANFFFGGFGNNWVDHGSIKRYHDYYSFPGVNISEVGGRNFAKSTLEWSLPPLRFRRAGSPGFYTTWARTSLFASGIRTNIDQDDFDRRLWNVGSQVDIRFTLLSRLNMTLSLGYAMAFERDADRKEEFMFSLKILD